MAGGFKKFIEALNKPIGGNTTSDKKYSKQNKHIIIDM